MKCVLALSFFLAVANAGGIYGVGLVPSTGHVVSTPTSSQYHSQDVLGQYAYGYDSPLSSKHEARSFDGITRGGYSYLDGHGLKQSAEYVSDPYNGFRVAATNLPVGPGVPAPAIHEAPVAVQAYHAVAPSVVHAGVHPGVVAAPGVTSHSSLVTADGILSHASVGPVSHSTLVTRHGTSVISPYAHSLAHPYSLPYIHRRKRDLVALGHTPASTAPLGVAVHGYAAPLVHAYAAPAVHAYAAPYAAPYAHAYATPYAHSVVAPGVATSRYHAQDELGQYSYGYNDGVSAKQEVRTHDGVTRGAYSYVDPRGIIQSVNYAADGLGFRAAASNII